MWGIYPFIYLHGLEHWYSTLLCIKKLSRKHALDQRCVVRGIALSSLLSCRLPGQPELARLTCGAHLGPPVLTRKQKRPRVNSLVCDRAAVFCAAGLPEALSWMSRLVTQAAKRERELARAHSQRLKQATLTLPGESVSRGFADRGALEGYPSHYTSLIGCVAQLIVISAAIDLDRFEFGYRSFQ